MSATRSDERRYLAVLERDASRRAEFVYAVTTTGVFCRPGCPARAPRRQNVRFFPDAGSARRGGFRPCRRCRPESVAPAPAGDPRGDELVDLVLAALDEDRERTPSLRELARRAGTSPSQLLRRFKSRTGLTPREVQARRRLERFKEHVRRGAGVAAATFGAGFGSSRGLYERARQDLGMTPARYARGGAGLDVAFALGGCHAGRALVACTADGVCAVLLGDDDQALVRELAREFPGATLRGAGAASARQREWIARVQSYLAGTRVVLGAPLDERGTPFQLEVWRELRRIPRGAVRSYEELARRIGRPGAARAVARACAANRLLVLVPCHRVVRKDGSPGGYRAGAGRKRRLLAQESGAPGTR